jgi:hypothetical protein
MLNLYSFQSIPLSSHIFSHILLAERYSRELDWSFLIRVPVQFQAGYLKMFQSLMSMLML